MLQYKKKNQLDLRYIIDREKLFQTKMNKKHPELKMKKVRENAEKSCWLMNSMTTK